MGRTKNPEGGGKYGMPAIKVQSLPDVKVSQYKEAMAEWVTLDELTLLLGVDPARIQRSLNILAPILWADMSVRDRDGIKEYRWSHFQGEAE